MGALFNQFSAILIYIILALLILSLVLWRLPLARRRLAMFVGLGVMIVGGLILFRPVHEGVTAVAVSEVIANGSDTPVFVELYSDY